MTIIHPTANNIFRKIEEESNIVLFRSPVSLPLSSNQRSFEGWYAFYENGAIRIEIVGEDIVGVAVWSTPDTLNNPEYHLDTTNIDIFGEIDTIIKMMRGKGNSFLSGHTVQENVVSDVENFLVSIGPMAYNKNLSTLYTSYLPWAEVNDKKALQVDYFIDLAKQWLVQNKKGHYANIKIEKGNNNEKTLINQEHSESFQKNIIQNEIYHKAKICEQAIRRISQHDPILNGIFICGTSGEDKEEAIKDILKEEKVWDTEVVSISHVLGFTSLLKFLYDNRKGKILLITKSDKILKYKEKRPFSIAYQILLQALVTEEKYRVIHYLGKDNQEEDKE